MGGREPNREDLIDMKADLLGFESALKRYRRNAIIIQSAWIISVVIMCISILLRSGEVSELLWVKIVTVLWLGTIAFLAWSAGNGWMAYRQLRDTTESFRLMVQKVEEHLDEQ